MSVPAELLGVRYREGHAGHVESWFLKANEPGGRRALWVRHTIFARPTSSGVPPVAEAWAIAFDRERGQAVVKGTVPLSAARFARGTVDVEVDGCALSLGRATGELATGRRRVGWDLAIGPERSAPIIHLARPLYDAPVPSSKLVTPLSDARVDGRVDVTHEDGTTASWDVSSWPAMLGHNWGERNADFYAWGHCNAWDDAEDLVFEAVSARIRMGPLLSPMGTIAFVRYRGASYDFNTAAAFATNRGSTSLRRWECRAAIKGASLTCELAAETDDIVGLHYPNPDSRGTYCLNTKLARARLELKTPDGVLTATSRAAALELGTLDADHGVRMYA